MIHHVTLIILALALLLVGCAQQTTTSEPVEQTIPPLKVGVLLPLSGEAAAYGLGMKRGIDLANQDLGATVELIVEDSQCDSKAAVTAFTKLATVDKVQAVIGEACSGATLAVAPLADQYGVVLISPGSTSPKITDAGQFVFRVVPSDALQGSFAAQLLNKEGSKRLAILYSNEEYGLGFSSVLEEKFIALGGEVVAKEAVNRGTVDLRTPLTKIRDRKPDTIFLISNSPDSVVAALKQIKELGIDASLYGSEGLKSDDILSGAGIAAEGLTVTSVSAGTTDFTTHHIATFGEAPGPFAAQGYDAFKAILLAAQVQSAPVTGESLRDQLIRTGFDGASGTIRFDEHGDVAGNYDVYTVQNGTFVLQ